MSMPDIQWPAIGFQNQFRVEIYANAKQFSVEYGKYASHREGMLLVDSALRRWSVDSVTKLEPFGPLWLRVLSWCYGLLPYWLEQPLTYFGDTTLDEVKRLIIERIDGNPEAWWNDEVMAGEDGPPVETEVYLQSVKDRMLQAPDMAALFAMEEFDIGDRFFCYDLDAIPERRGG